jgi:spore coat protein U-like protein
MYQALTNPRLRFALVLIMLIFGTAVPDTSHATGRGASASQCSVAATPIAFGDYAPLADRDDVSVGMVHYRCDGRPSRLVIALTTGKSGSYAFRRMGQGPHAVKYNLYLDAARTQIWGDGTRGSQAYIVNSPISGTEVSIPVYGLIFGNQNASAGNYHDDVSVVVTY